MTGGIKLVADGVGEGGVQGITGEGKPKGRGAVIIGIGGGVGVEVGLPVKQGGRSGGMRSEEVLVWAAK